VDNLDSVWQMVTIALVAGVLIGALAYRLLSPSVKRIDEVESEEMVSYKASVNQHFNKTSELVNDLTQNYVKVYQHLADGAQTLGDIGTLTNLLERGQGKLSIAVSDAANVQDAIPEDSPIDAAEIQAGNEDSEQSVAVEINETGPKDYDDGTANTQVSESMIEAGEPDESGDPVTDVDSAKAESESADTDVPSGQDREDADVTGEKEPDAPAKKET